MTSFDRNWLSLREPVDHRSRARGPQDACAHHFRGRERITVLDLGSGTGSNLRASWRHLPNKQEWRLVDRDMDLLQAAREMTSKTSDALPGSGRPMLLPFRAASSDARNRIRFFARCSRWAGAPRLDGDRIAFEKDGKTIGVSFECADLRTDIERLLSVPPDLVTAAAFFDLVSPGWIEHFASALAEARLPLYTVLTYDGRESWDPAHPADGLVNAAFNEHQTRSKGFGPAAGPAAARHLTSALKRRGYAIATGDSPWILTRQDNGLIQSLANGIEQAVGETGLVPGEILAAWREAHRHPVECRIGHVDLFASPP